MLYNPWFWAFVAAVGWCMAFFLVGSRAVGGRVGLGIVTLIAAETPRLVLPLWFVEQPRFAGPEAVYTVAGGLILVVALAFGTPALRIRPLTRPSGDEPLRTDGLYSVVRHPIMVCETLWPLGWSLMNRSIIGVALTGVWALIADLETRFEEEKLLEEYGDTYRGYQRRVPRLVPSFRTKPRGRETPASSTE